MSKHNRHSKADRILAGCFATLLIIGGLLIILYSTLSPFKFQVHRLTFVEYMSGYDLLPSSVIDFPQNILLFVPLGFGLGVILDQFGWSKNRIRFAVLLSGLLLTIFVESSQQFLPTRQPSLADLIGNTLGAIAGLACLRLWQKHKAKGVRLENVFAVPKNAAVALAFYLLFLLLMAYGLSTSVRYDDWDTEYRMMLGNEQTGDRPWIGSVGDLVVFNRVLEPAMARDLLQKPKLALVNSEGLLAYYPLTGNSTLLDLTENQPILSWQPAVRIGSDARTNQLDEDGWLETETAVKDLSDRLQETSQMSIRLSMSTGELEQTGPARILTISEDPFLRNLTFGQEGDNLVMRFRSPLSGKNGTIPQILFPDFFTSSDTIDFVLTYDGLTITLIDSRSRTVRSVEMVPGVAFFFRYLRPLMGDEATLGQASATAFIDWAYRLLFYTVVLLPLAILISLPSVMAWPQRERLILILSSLLVIPILLELVLVGRSGHGLRPLNIVTTVLVIVTIAWVLIPAVRRFSRLEDLRLNGRP